ncbi:MAG: hypothetical protein FJW86_09180 [Actinobacteria bacterium]|nr:hypothetical protein [Actinomycetota bacterium]
MRRGGLLTLGVVLVDATGTSTAVKDAARAAYQGHKATAKGGVKCGTVQNLIEGSSSVDYEKVKVPKVGDGSHAIGRSSEGGEPAIGVELLSGPYVCILTTYGNDFSPTLKDLKALAKAAEKQLSSGS